MLFRSLVLATGAAHSYFGHTDWATVAPGLKTVNDATYMRRLLLMAFERAEMARDASTRQRLLQFVVVGGGPTGVELAGAIAELAHRTLARDFRVIDPRSARVVLLEAGPRILPMFSESLSDFAQKSLQRLGVEVRVDSAVTHCDRGGVNIGDVRLDAGTVIWAAGVAASAAGRWLGAETDAVGRVVVEPDLSVPGQPNVFVVGDAARVEEPGGGLVPGLAPAAKQAGRYVAKVIRSRIEGRNAPDAFRYRQVGYFATIGRSSAVIEYGRLRLRGLIAWWLWGVAHIYFLVGLRSPVIVTLHWLWQYLTYGRGARLITGREDSVPGPDQPQPTPADPD